MKTKPGLNTEERMKVNYPITDVDVGADEPFGLSVGNHIKNIKRAIIENINDLALKEYSEDEYYHGNVAFHENYIITEDGDMFEFKYGYENIEKAPILLKVKSFDAMLTKKKIQEGVFNDTFFIFDDKRFDPLGEASIYSGSDGTFLFEY